MKHFLAVLLLVVTIFSAGAQNIPPKPNPPRLVNDLADRLTSAQEAQLERKLVDYNDSTSTEITIVVIPTLDDYPIADYAFELGEKWKVGKKGKDNGAVLLWAPKERKVFLATGYGLEGAIPDIIAKRITADIIAPKFKQDQYFEGLNEGVDAIFKYATGEYKAEKTDRRSQEDGSPSPLLIFIIVFVIILIVMFRNRGNGGGGIGRSRRGLGGPVFWPYTTFTGGGGYSGNWDGGGGSGGFGGFGGGSFGGGGAGSDY